MPKEKIRSMLDNLINDNSEQAQVDFHDYLQDKMKDVIGIENPAAAEVEDEIAAEEDKTEE